MVKNVVKKVTVRLTEEEKSAVIMLAKKENKSIQNFIYDRIMPAQNQQNADVKNDELVADLKRQLQKREEEIQKLHQLIDQSQKLLLNEQNKNQLLLSENIDEKNPGGNFGNDFFRKGDWGLPQKYKKRHL